MRVVGPHVRPLTSIARAVKPARDECRTLACRLYRVVHYLLKASVQRITLESVSTMDGLDGDHVPIIAAHQPARLTLPPGVYLWCSCGRSERQPWCDDSHQGTGFQPVRVVIDEQRRVSMCQCKHSSKAPFCDGSHGDLP